ncbi:hypothetical protein PV08_06867 [Exophiala spinifera]|uniref:GH16 domain-containing protein n=1 Tax=Exophiala spinifera TaxID=91928 RepID=A0A0D1YGG6_9EURO|nr:uncharacterized protein PV08_06867 [Exophiala spinifera]KIW14086.1 hypothetical protein PV08_06867 [Exophiala spinifera]
MPFRERIKELCGGCFREPTTGEDLQQPPPLPVPLPDVGKDGIYSPSLSFISETSTRSTYCPRTEETVPISTISTYIKAINILSSLHLAPLAFMILVLSNLIAVNAFSCDHIGNLAVVTSANRLSERDGPGIEPGEPREVRKGYIVGPPWSYLFYPPPPFGYSTVPGISSFPRSTQSPAPLTTTPSAPSITNTSSTSVVVYPTTTISPYPLSSPSASPASGVSPTSASRSTSVPDRASFSPTIPGTASSSRTSSSSSTKSVATTNTSAPIQTSNVVQVGNQWLVPEAGIFDNRASFTFGNGFPDGLQISNYSNHQRGSGPSPEVPYNPKFDPANVHIMDGMLALTVPGHQRPNKHNGWALSSAEVTTVKENILHGSVRTRAILSKVPGTCHGFFFYRSDTQEIDIEYLTDPSSLSNNGPGKRIPMHYTNQAVDPEDEPETQATGTSPLDCTTAVHEYRIDWTSDYTAFYLDGKLQKKFTTNVPSESGPWVWNNWANGNKGWSVGPPSSDNILLIKSIEMYYNTD